MLDGADPVTCRPADLLEPELENLTNELNHLAIEKRINLAEDVVDDVLTYALFPQIGIRFLQNRDNPGAFEPPPWEEPAEGQSGPVAAEAAPAGGEAVYSVRVNGKQFTVEVAASGQLSVGAAAAAIGPDSPPTAASTVPTGNGEPVNAALAGNVFKVHVEPGAAVAEGDPLLIVEAMKMETVVPAPRAGTVTEVFVAEGDKVAVGDALVAIG